MPIVEISIPNLKELLFNFKRYPAISEKWLQRAIAASGAEIHKWARAGVVPAKTYRLVQSFGERPTIGRLWARIAPTVKYAPYVYFGTRPHIIRYTKPGRGGLYDKKTGQGFGRWVQHPGTKENRFLDRMVKLAEPQTAKYFKEAGDNILKEIGKI